MAVVVDVPPSEEAFFANLMQELGYNARVQEQGSDGVPEWHKTIVRERLATAKPEDYIPLEDVLRKWDIDDSQG